MGNAAGGVHIGALGGLWQAAVFGVAGLRAREDGIAVDPHLLPGWAEMRVFRAMAGTLAGLRLDADPARIEVDVETVGELTVAVVEARHAVHVPAGATSWAAKVRDGEPGRRQANDDPPRHCSSPSTARPRDGGAFRRARARHLMDATVALIHVGREALAPAALLDRMGFRPKTFAGW